MSTRAQQCECLFCERAAAGRITVPHVKPRTAMCKEHLDEYLAWADRYRRIPGMVQIEAAP